MEFFFQHLSIQSKQSSLSVDDGIKRRFFLTFKLISLEFLIVYPFTGEATEQEISAQFLSSFENTHKKGQVSYTVSMKSLGCTETINQF